MPCSQARMMAEGTNSLKCEFAGAHAATMPRSDGSYLFPYLRVSDQDFGGEDQCNDGSGVLQRKPCDFGITIQENRLTSWKRH